MTANKKMDLAELLVILGGVHPDEWTRHTCSGSGEDRGFSCMNDMVQYRYESGDLSVTLSKNVYFNQISPKHTPVGGTMYDLSALNSQIPVFVSPEDPIAKSLFNHIDESHNGGK